MTIAEIESTLRTLCIRHPNIDDELLVTLLTAGGWEEKVIKEAVSLFKGSPNTYKTAANAAVLLPYVANTSQVVPPTPAVTESPLIITQVDQSNQSIAPSPSDSPVVAESKNNTSDTSPIVYYKDGGEEESSLPDFVDVVTINSKEDIILKNDNVNESAALPSNTVEIPLIDLTEKIEIPKDDDASLIVSSIMNKEEITNTLPTPALQKIEKGIEEPQSLIVPPPLVRAAVERPLPPENLPLKPFESTPHVWPFSKYKEVFHGDVMPPLKADERVLVQAEKPSEVIVPQVKKIKIKRTGFDGEDEGLIFLTSTTLLIILLLLAYMYSNGRI